MRPTFGYLLFLGALLLASASPLLAEEEGSWQGSEETVDGVLHVENPSIPVEGEVDLSLEKLFSLGGESEDDDELFGLVQNILLDQQGNTYLLDQQLGEIRVFDARGGFLRTIGREGEGPGEFQNPQTFFFLPDGKFGVAQMMPARIAVLDREGEGSDDFPVPGGDEGFAMVRKVESAGDHLVMQEMVGSFGEGTMINTNRLIALDGQGKETVVYGESSKEFEVGAGQMVISMGDEDFGRIWSVSDDGRVYAVNDYTGYRIQVYGPDGTLERVVEREYEPLPFTKEEKKLRQKRWEETPRGGGIEVKPDFPDLRQDITDLIARPGGELWVRTSRSTRDDHELGSFDVFDAQGRFVRVLRPQIEFDHARDGYVITGNRFYRIKELNGALKAWAAGFGGGIRIGVENDGDEEEEDEPAPLEIITYRIASLAP